MIVIKDTRNILLHLNVDLSFVDGVNPLILNKKY